MAIFSMVPHQITMFNYGGTMILLTMLQTKMNTIFWLPRHETTGITNSPCKNKHHAHLCALDHLLQMYAPHYSLQFKLFVHTSFQISLPFNIRRETCIHVVSSSVDVQ